MSEVVLGQWGVTLYHLEGIRLLVRLFGGLPIEETAKALGTSPATAKRNFAVARAWLYREMERTTGP